MRATINFEADVDQVEGTMAVLSCAEEHNLRAAADILSNYTVLDGSLLDTLTEVLRLMEMSTVQLRQYQQMMLNFERARFETQIPQDLTNSVLNLREAKKTLEQMSNFDTFVDQINTNEETNDDKSEEG